jgi:L-malate glycosyltransferase
MVQSGRTSLAPGAPQACPSWHLACSAASVLVRGPIPLAVVLNSFEPGGTEHQMTELICRLDRNAFNVHAVCLGNRGVLRTRVADAGIPILEFPLRGFARVSAAVEMVRFARWCRAQRIRIVHACDFYANVFALPAATLARVPVRLASRRDVFVPERRPGHLRLQHVAYTFAHRIVVNSGAAAARLQDEGVARAKVVHIANGLDLARYAPPPTREGHVVTTVANLRPGKGHEVLLDAAARVLARHPDVRFQLVGDGSRRAELEHQAAALGIASQVTFRGYCSDVAGVLRESDVFAFPSFMEASPNAVLEAMAAGLPVVATHVGGIPEVVSDGRNGLLVPPGDADALAGGLLRVLEAPDRGRALGEAARQTASTQFSFERMVGQFEQLYRSELAGRTSDGRDAAGKATAA